MRVVAEFTTGPADTPVRACQCSFCRAHGARTTSDPAGVLKFWAQDWAQVIHYRFGTEAADLLICAKCGVFVGAVANAVQGSLGVVNVNALTAQAQFTTSPKAFSPDAEARDERQARWAKTWMPAVVHH